MGGKAREKCIQVSPACSRVSVKTCVQTGRSKRPGREAEQEEGDVEAVNAWLIKLDNARMNKKLPNILYDKIKVYINESITYDHKKLIGNYEFFN